MGWSDKPLFAGEKSATASWNHGDLSTNHHRHFERENHGKPEDFRVPHVKQTVQIGLCTEMSKKNATAVV